MPQPSSASDEPLLQNSNPHCARCRKVRFMLLTVFIGLGFAILAGSVPGTHRNGQHLFVQKPTITMAQRFQMIPTALKQPYLFPAIQNRIRQNIRASCPNIAVRGTAAGEAPTAAADVDQVAIDAVGDQIRTLKGKLKSEGLSGADVNAHPEVKALVEKLKALKTGAATAEIDAPKTAGIAMDPSLMACYSSAVGGRSQVARILSDGQDLIGQKVSICGWVKTKREAMKGAVMFLEVNDGSCQSSIQVVVDQDAKGFENVKNGGGTGSSVKCSGTIVKSEGGKQKTELLVKSAEDEEVVLFGSVADPDLYAMAKGRPSLEYLRENAHLRPRSNIIGSVARVRSALAKATHDFFTSKGFLYVHTPLITSSDCEGAGEMFQVTTLLKDAEKGELPRDEAKNIDYTKDFFGKPSFLTVSGQLAVEPYCCSLSNVYTFGPTFRSENSNTVRHLAEFWMIEPELAFADIYDDMQCAEDYLKACVSYVMEHAMEDLKFFDMRVEKGLIKRLENLLKEPFDRVSYTDAIDILKKDSSKANFEVPVEWGMDLGSEHERWLVEKVTKKPTIVFNYPKDIKAFYMRLNDDEKTVAAMDLLVPRIGELIGGSQREERLDVLDRRMVEMNLNPEEYWWYRDLRRFGSVPHAGFGLGFERLIMLCTGVENVRETIPYPRSPNNNNF